MGLSAAQARALQEAHRSTAAGRKGGAAGPRRCGHGVEQASCRQCGGGRRCVHLEERKFCVRCAGARVCEHGRIRVVCVECGGNRVCRTCRARIVLKRDTDCTVCQGAREWAAWMEGRAGVKAIYSKGTREGDAGAPSMGPLSVMGGFGGGVGLASEADVPGLVQCGGTGDP